MPQNKAYEDEEATSGLEDSRPGIPTQGNSTETADESTALQDVSTYFSDEKILIPEPPRVSFAVHESGRNKSIRNCRSHVKFILATGPESHDPW